MILKNPYRFLGRGESPHRRWSNPTKAQGCSTFHLIGGDCLTTQKILNILQPDIHSVVFATLGEHDLPQTCVIDLMLVDDDGLYLLTAKGKSFYHRLMKKPLVALSGMKGGDTLSTTAISVGGVVRNVGEKRLAEILEKNPYMTKVYPAEKNREALEVFQLYKGRGEYFDLAQLPSYRQSFSFGGKRIQENGYRMIPERCIGCQGRRNVCPVNCISNTIPRSIDPAHCLHCGNCLSIRPAGAVELIGAVSQAIR